MAIKLESNEIEILHTLLKEFVIKDLTGELGFVHGSDRFVSTNICLKKQHRRELKELYLKLGIANFPKEI